MIVRNDHGFRWDVLEQAEGYCPAPEVQPTESYRISALLGPDGQPLRVGYERPRMGFNLRPSARGGRS